MQQKGRNKQHGSKDWLIDTATCQPSSNTEWYRVSIQCQCTVHIAMSVHVSLHLIQWYRDSIQWNVGESKNAKELKKIRYSNMSAFMQYGGSIQCTVQCQCMSACDVLQSRAIVHCQYPVQCWGIQKCKMLKKIRYSSMSAWIALQCNIVIQRAQHPDLKFKKILSADLKTTQYSEFTTLPIWFYVHSKIPEKGYISI